MPLNLPISDSDITYVGSSFSSGHNLLGSKNTSNMHRKASIARPLAENKDLMLKSLKDWESRDCTEVCGLYCWWNNMISTYLDLPWTLKDTFIRKNKPLLIETFCFFGSSIWLKVTWWLVIILPPLLLGSHTFPKKMCQWYNLVLSINLESNTPPRLSRRLSGFSDFLTIAYLYQPILSLTLWMSNSSCLPSSGSTTSICFIYTSTSSMGLIISTSLSER